MIVSNNLNSLIQLEKKLEESSNNLKKLTQKGGNQASNSDKKDLKREAREHKEVKTQSEPTIVEEIVEQDVIIPMAYTANAEVISMQDNTTKTIIDIRV
jgi:predicted amino acid racemase